MADLFNYKKQNKVVKNENNWYATEVVTVNGERKEFQVMTMVMMMMMTAVTVKKW